MQKLVRGIHKFQSNVFSSQRDLFERLARGQSPETLFITCSDSRISPSLLTQTQPGDLFIARNAGNIVPPHGAGPASGEGATIEYAVAALGVRDLIVCGHTGCGAMAALLDRSKVADLPAVDSWLAHAEATRRIVGENYGHLEGEALQTACAEENVLVQLENLRTHPAVAARLAAGKVKLHGWMYKIVTGEVFAYDNERAEFAPLAEVARSESLPSPTRSGRIAI